MLHYSVLAIVLAIVANIIIGWFWYSPVLFGSKWAKAYQLEKDQTKPSPLHFLGAIIVSAIKVIALAILFTRFGIQDLKTAIQVILIIWFGFLASSHFSGVIWAKKPLVVYFIDIGNLLLNLLVTSVLLLVVSGTNLTPV